MASGFKRASSSAWTNGADGPTNETSLERKHHSTTRASSSSACARVVYVTPPLPPTPTPTTTHPPTSLSHPPLSFQPSQLQGGPWRRDLLWRLPREEDGRGCPGCRVRVGLRRRDDHWSSFEAGPRVSLAQNISRRDGDVDDEPPEGVGDWDAAEGGDRGGGRQAPGIYENM